MSISAADLPKRVNLSAMTNAAGQCVITFRSQAQVAWEVSQVTIDMPTAPAGAIAELRVNGQLVTPMIAAGDAAAGDPPLPVYPGDVVTITWTGATPGDQGKALIIYRTARYTA